MTELERVLAEREIARLPLLFAHYVDNGDHASLAGLFTPDCQFARPFQPDHPFHGREKVQAIFRDRPPILVRHIVTNVLIEVIGETQARGTSYLTMLSSHQSVEPPQEAGAIYVGGFADDYVKTGEGWQFARRMGRVVLHMGGPMPVIPPPTNEARGLT